MTVTWHSSSTIFIVVQRDAQSPRTGKWLKWDENSQIIDAARNRSDLVGPVRPAVIIPIESELVETYEVARITTRRA